MRGWKECKLGDVVRLNYGKGFPRQQAKPPHISRKESAWAIWQKSMETSWVQQANPFARRSA